MVNSLVWLFGIALVCFVFLIVCENIAENLPPENKFRKWWRNNVIGDDDFDNIEF
jgi:hypothetical protein